MSTVLIGVPVLTVALTIARVSLLEEFSLLKNSIHYCIETLPSRTCTYTSVRTAGSRKAVTLFSETVHDRRHAPIEIARTHLVRVS